MSYVRDNRVAYEESSSDEGEIEVASLFLFIYFFKFVRWGFGYCGHYWPIVPAPDDR
jgi:hypothetical protein